MGNDQSAAVAPGMAPILAQQPVPPAPSGPMKAGSFALGDVPRSKSDLVTSAAGGHPAFTRSSSDIVTSGAMMRDLDRRAAAAPTLPMISEQSPAPASAVPNYSLGQMPGTAPPPLQKSPANSFGALTPLETWPPSLSALGRPGPANMQFQSPSASVEAKPVLAPMPVAQTPPVAPMPSMTPAPVPTPAPAPMKRTQATVLGTQIEPLSSAGKPPAAMPNYAPAGNFATSPASYGMVPSRSSPALPTVGATQTYGQAASVAYQQRPASYSPGFAPSAPITSQPFSYSGSTLPTTAGYGYGGSAAAGYGLPQSSYVQQANTFKPQVSAPQMPYMQQPNYMQPQVSAAMPSYAQPQVSAAMTSYSQPQISAAIPSYAQPQVSATMPSYAQPQVSATMPSYAQPQVSATMPSYAQPQVSATMPSYAQPQVSAAMPSYAQPQVSAAMPSYTQPQVSAAMPSYAQPLVSAAMPSYAQQMPGWGATTTSPSYSSISPQAPYQAPALNYSAASSAYGYVPPVASNLGFSGAVSSMPSMVGSFSPTSYAPSSFAPSIAGPGGFTSSGYLPQQAYASSPYRMF